MPDEFCTEIKSAPKKLYFGSEAGYNVKKLVLHLVIEPNACMERISLLLFYEKQSIIWGNEKDISQVLIPLLCKSLI